MIIFEFPKYVKPNNCTELLKNLEGAFGMENKSVPEVKINLRKLEKTSLLGVLINYKFIEYTYKNYCFKKAELIVNDYVMSEWERYGFTELFNLYISNKDITEKWYKKLNVKVDDRFIIAPQALLRDNNYSQTFLNTNFLPKIEEYYSGNEKAVSMIFLCLSEILLNFWEHAIDDTNSILVAEGNINHIEIACADTGNGIITTLEKTLDKKINTKPLKILEAVKKNVTSKKNTNHMGYGLYILNEIATRAKGRFHIYSEGAYYTNDFGTIKNNNCGYWKGTIIYLSLPLSKPITLSDIEDCEQGKLKEIKINFK